MTISQILLTATAKLQAKNINNPLLEAEILLSCIIKKPREFLLVHGEKKLSQAQIKSLLKLLARRLKGEPIAYLTGQKEFYGLNFLVNRNVLIPRPETELMVEEALKLAELDNQAKTFIDVGTGSGCVIITLAKILKSKTNNFIGVDISTKALSVAQLNAKYHNLAKKIKFIVGDLLAPAIKNPSFTRHNSLIVLANLPYGWKAWKNNCSIDTIGLKFEPPIALYTGKDGLELYEKLFKQIKKLRVVKCGLRDISVLCEFDPRQTAKIKRLVKKQLPQATCQIKKDLAGLNRLIIINMA